MTVNNYFVKTASFTGKQEGVKQMTKSGLDQKQESIRLDTYGIFEAFMKDEKSRMKSAKHLAQETKIILDFLDHLAERGGREFPLEEVKPELLKTWSFKGTGSSNTARMKYYLVRRFILWATENQFIGHSKAMSGKAPQKIARYREVLTPAEIQRVKDHLASPPVTNTKLKQAVSVELAMRGMRHMEMLRLKWTDIHGDRFKIITKGSQIRSFGIDGELQELLDKRHKFAFGKFVCVDTEAEEPHNGSFCRMFRKLLKRCGIERDGYMGPHLWRHSVATLLMEETEDLLRVKNFLGHKQASTTEGYIHRGIKQNMDSLKMIKDAIKRKEEKDENRTTERNREPEGRPREGGKKKLRSPGDGVERTSQVKKGSGGM